MVQVDIKMGGDVPDKVAEMLEWTDQRFTELVDQDIRDKLQSHNRPYAGWLRNPIMAERWYQALVALKKNVESTIAARKSESLQQRMEMLSAATWGGDDGDVDSPPLDDLQIEDLRRRADRIHRDYLRWRTGALRFRAGCEERLAEASWRRKMSPAIVPAHLLEELGGLRQQAVVMQAQQEQIQEGLLNTERERAALAARVQVLEAAIRRHQDSMAEFDDKDIADADRELWQALVPHEMDGQGRSPRGRSRASSS